MHYRINTIHLFESLHVAKIQRIVQNDDGWQYFIRNGKQSSIDPKENITPTGIVRLNDSIIALQ
jgi:hypothetical protein